MSRAWQIAALLTPQQASILRWVVTNYPYQGSPMADTRALIAMGLIQPSAGDWGGPTVLGRQVLAALQGRGF